jgi:hypothetical protein
MATIGITGDTQRLLQRAASQLDELGHRLAAAEERAARETREAQARADDARYLTSREHLMELDARKRELQARADDALSTWGLTASPSYDGEPFENYRLRLAQDAQRRLPKGDEYRNINLRKIKNSDEVAFTNFENAIYPRAKQAGTGTDSVAEGELRMVTRLNPVNGYKENLFYGKESFVKAMGRPGRRVYSFCTPRDPRGERHPGWNYVP